MGQTEWWSEEEVVRASADPKVVTVVSQEVVKELEQGSFDISVVVERLGPCLTATEVHKRKSAISFLSEILRFVPSGLLTESQLKFIVSFYNDRLRDNHSIVPAVLAGTTALSSMAHLPEEEFLKLLFCILGGSVITCQSQQREDRSLIFDLIDLSSKKYSDKLLAHKLDFIQGVINAIEGERDPRNLLKLFTFMPGLISRFPLEHWAEEMFEVFACYYPIDFYPSANDPNSITRDVLAERLQACLLAAKAFLEHLVPLSLEKLESQLKVAKLDSLALLSGAARTYGTEELEDKFESIWMSFKTELLPGQADEVHQAALDTLATFVESCQTQQTCENILNTIFHSISISLCDVNLRLFGPAMKIAFAVAKSRQQAAVYVTNKIMPIFIRQLDTEDLDKSENIEQKLAVLKLLIETIKICNQHNVLDEIESGIVASAQNHLLKCIQQLQSSEALNLGYQGFSEICIVASEENRQTLYRSVLQVLALEGRDSSSVIECVRKFGMKFNSEIFGNVLEPILKNETFLNFKNSENVFQLFCTLLDISDCDNSKLYHFLLDHIFRFSDTTLNLNDEEATDNDTLIAVVALTSLTNLLTTTKNIKIRSQLIGKYNIFDRFVESRSKFRHNSVLEQVTSVINLLIRNLSIDEQRSVLSKFLPQLCATDGKDVFLLAGFLANCSNDVNLEGNFAKIVLEAIDFSLDNGDQDRVEVANHLICFLFNRTHQNGDEYERVLSSSVDKLYQLIDSESRGIQTLTWITKALLTRGHPKAEEIVLKIVSYLTVLPLSKSATEAFEIIARNPTFQLPNTRLFYKQKLFDLVMKHLIKPDVQLDAIALKAVGTLLGNLPMVLLRTNIAKVGPILFQCLQLGDPATVSVALEILKKFIVDQDQFCKDRIQYLIPQCLELSQFKEKLKIRVLALECLFNMSKYPTYLLLPFKLDVQFGLQAALDDHKRLVRTAAVRARTCWFLIDAPSKD